MARNYVLSHATHKRQVKDILPTGRAFWELLPDEIRRNLSDAASQAATTIRIYLHKWAELLENKLLASYIVSFFEPKLLRLEEKLTEKMMAKTNPLIYLASVGMAMNFAGIDERAVWLSGVVPIRVWRKLVNDPLFRERFFAALNDLLEKHEKLEKIPLE